MKFLLIIQYFFLSMECLAYKLTSFIPENNPTGVGVIICPGGSYFWLDKEYEGYDVARWLNENGIAAFVLEYSHGGWASFAFHVRTKGRTFPAGYEDLRNALLYVKSNADLYGIKSNRIGCLGFSAGGHLVMHAAEQLVGVKDTLVSPPMFVSLIYPVVSMSHPCAHKRSRRGLLGEKASEFWKDSLSLEKHVPDNCPPVFLVNCDDDLVVHPHNSELLDSALFKHNIPHQYEHYRTGGHGFGVCERKTTHEAIQWKQRFLEWINKIIVTKK